MGHLLLVVGTGIAAAALIVAATWEERQHPDPAERMLFMTRPTSMNRLRPGFVRITGLAHAGRDMPKAPITGKACLVSQARIPSTLSDAGERRGRPRSELQVAGPFWIENADGHRVFVDPAEHFVVLLSAQAAVCESGTLTAQQTARLNERFTPRDEPALLPRRWRTRGFSELRVEPGMLLTVAGNATMEAHAEGDANNLREVPRRWVMRPPHGAPMVISNHPRLVTVEDETG